MSAARSSRRERSETSRRRPKSVARSAAAFKTVAGATAGAAVCGRRRVRRRCGQRQCRRLAVGAGRGIAAARYRNQQEHDDARKRRGGSCRHQLLLADAGFGHVLRLVLGEARGLHLARGGRGRVAAFREDDVGRHQRLARFDVVAGALVDVAEFGHGRGGFVERGDRGRRRRLVQRLERRGDRSHDRRHLRHPERDALSRSDVGLLRRAQVGERIARVVRVLIEGAQRRGVGDDLFFGVVEQEGRNADRDPGCRAERQSKR